MARTYRPLSLAERDAMRDLRAAGVSRREVATVTGRHYASPALKRLAAPRDGSRSIQQGRAEVARLAHNQKVGGSNPSPATSFKAPRSASPDGAATASGTPFRAEAPADPSTLGLSRRTAQAGILLPPAAQLAGGVRTSRAFHSSSVAAATEPAGQERPGPAGTVAGS